MIVSHSSTRGVRPCQLRPRHCQRGQRGQRGRHHVLASASHRTPVRYSYSERKVAALAGTSELFREPRVSELPYEARTAVLQALSELGDAGTAAEIAARAGVPISEAERILQAVAIEGSGRLKVTESGDVIYSFPSNVGLRLQQHDLSLRTEATLRASATVLERVTRIMFGTVLVASIAFAATALVALAVASSSSSDSDGPSFSLGGGGESRDSGGGGGGSFWLWVDPWPTVYGDSRRSRRRNQGGVGGFFEDAFALVFGGRNPNEGFEEARWKAVGERIVARGGVVAAEEILPLLEIPQGSDPREEDYMLPVLLRFNGTVEITSVTTAGTESTVLLYRFPELQRRAALGAASSTSKLAGGRPAGAGLRRAVSAVSSWARDVGDMVRSSWDSGDTAVSKNGSTDDSAFVGYSGEQPFAKQKQRKLFDVERDNIFGLTLLVTANTTLLGILATYVADPVAMKLLRQSAGAGFTGLVATVTPLLCVYAALYFVGPLVRFIRNKFDNARIDEGNTVRRRAALALDQPSIELQGKLQRARREAQVVDISRAPTAYDTARSSEGSAGKGDAEYELDDWDARLKRRL